MDSARTIQALTECDAISAALKAEHYAIEDALQTLDAAIIAGATPDALARIVDIVVDFCVAHFASEEKEFRAHEYAGTAAHARAHAQLLQKFRAARQEISEGNTEAIMNAAGILNSFHNHVGKFDRAAHAYLLRKQFAAGGDTVRQQGELAQLYRLKHANYA